MYQEEGHGGEKERESSVTCRHGTPFVHSYMAHVECNFLYVRASKLTEAEEKWRYFSSLFWRAFHDLSFTAFCTAAVLLVKEISDLNETNRDKQTRQTKAECSEGAICFLLSAGVDRHVTQSVWPS